MTHLECFKEKLNALLVEEKVNIGIIDDKLAYVFPEIQEYSSGKTLQEKKVHSTGGVAICGNVHLGITMPTPLVWNKDGEIIEA